METVANNNSDDAKIWHRLGDWCLESGDSEKAATMFGKLAERFPSDGEASSKHRNALARLSLDERKDKRLNDLIEKPAEDDLEISGLGKTSDQLKAQVRQLQAQFDAGPSLDLARHLAVRHEELDACAEAAKWWDKASKFNPGDNELKHRAEQMRERAADARILELEKVLQSNPEESEAALARTELDDLRAEETQRRIAVSRRQVETNPTDTRLRFEFGRHLFQGARFNEAIAELQQARENPNLRHQTMLLLGRAYDEIGMSDLAADEFEEAANEIGEMSDLKKEFLYFLALTYERLGKSKDSMKTLKQIFKHDCSYRNVAELVKSSYPTAILTQ